MYSEIHPISMQTTNREIAYLPNPLPHFWQYNPELPAIIHIIMKIHECKPNRMQWPAVEMTKQKREKVATNPCWCSSTCHANNTQQWELTCENGHNNKPAVQN
jgi:hypothetical protein